MSGNEYLVDTNILIHLHQGNKAAAELLDGKEVFVSFITELELLSHPSLSEAQSRAIRKILDDCFIIELLPEIKEHTIALRKKHKLKLPDAIIASTAIHLGVPFLTADKGFGKAESINCIIVEL